MPRTDLPRVEARVVGTNEVITEELFCRRVYTCQRCGHVTPTRGWPLTDLTCWARLRVDGRRSTRCGGQLDWRYG